MSREIKFRAWDTKQNKWCGYEDTGSIIDLNHSIRHNCFMVDNDSYDFPKDLELSQFTGLKDKNGVEIYEADILEYRPSSGEFTNERYLVDWFSHGFSAIWYANGIQQRRSSTVLIGCDEDLAVIGNVHENPELLLPEVK